MGATNSKMMLFGDFNCHHLTWLNSANMHGESKTNSAGLACFAMCQTVGLVNLVVGNTFLCNKGHGEPTSDLVLTDSHKQAKNVSLGNAIGSSSHCRVKVTLRTAPVLNKTYSKVSWKYHRADWIGMNKYLKGAYWGNSCNVDWRWTSIKDSIKKAMDVYIPNVIIKHSVSDQPWFTDKCAIACSRKEKA